MSVIINLPSGSMPKKNKDVKIVTFADGTDEEIAKMIQAYYDQNLNIFDYWSIGDTRNITLSSMNADGVGESHRQQVCQFVIADFEHDILTTPINGHTRAAITLIQKDCFMDEESAKGNRYGFENTESGYINSTVPVDGGWETCDRRKWCNSVCFNSLPTEWKKMVKAVNKKSRKVTASNSAEIITTSDKVFLASAVEVYGEGASYSYAGEGTRYQYYANAAANVLKKPKWSSDQYSINNQYFLRGMATYGAAGRYFSASNIQNYDSASVREANSPYGGITINFCV